VQYPNLLRSKEQGILKTFVIGDIHGAYKALLQCLELSKFDKKNDRLICLGDVCDRGIQIKECIDELLTIPHCVYILGNHDAWALEWAIDGKAPQEWWGQGGANTAMSYQDVGMPKEHIRFLSQALLWFVDKNRLFVHGGFDPECSLKETSKEIFIWDRSLLKQAQERHLTNPDYKFGNYDEIFLGHSPTINFGKTEPQKFCNVWAMDTGAGWGAKLTIMDVDTKQFWQS
jgi:serine/threonine protein phosphatase 1